MSNPKNNKAKQLRLSASSGDSGQVSTDGLWAGEVLEQFPRSEPFFETRLGRLYNCDALDLLRSIKSESVDVIFADPPYNIGKTEWDEFSSMEKYLDWTEQWIREGYRILKEEGTMFVMGFSEILAHVTVRASQVFPNYRWLIWAYRNKPSLGKTDWVRSHEGILHLRKGESFTFNMDLIREPYNKHTRKYPERAQGETSQYGRSSENSTKGYLWAPNRSGAKPRDIIEVPVISNSAAERTKHPTQKPEELLRKLLLAVTNAGELQADLIENSSGPADLIVDPFGGSGTTYTVCEQFKLRWLGSENNLEYCEMVANRIRELPNEPLQYWLKLDQKRRRHRRKIRFGGS